MNHDQFTMAVKVLRRIIDINSDRIGWLEDSVSEWKYNVTVTKGKDVNTKMYLQGSKEDLNNLVEEQKSLKKMLNLLYTLKRDGYFEKF